MARLTTLVGVATLVLSKMVAGKYTLLKTYDASKFFDEFQIKNISDPSSGFVEYVDAATAKAKSLAGIRNGQVYLGADSVTENTTNGRKSVRVESTRITSPPGSSLPISPTCQVIPAASGQPTGRAARTGPTAARSISSLHSGTGCTVANTGSAVGSVLTNANCNTGCSQSTTDNQAYGDGFNAVKGGVYATQWTTAGIAIWFFPRANIPADITAGTPDPTTWGKPLTNFVDSGSCDFATHFKSNRFIFNINFCGWA